MFQGVHLKSTTDQFLSDGHHDRQLPQLFSEVICLKLNHSNFHL